MSGKAAGGSARLRVVPSDIKNKMKREEVYNRQRSEKAQLKLKRRLKIKKDEANNEALKEERLKENVPKTLENTREFDETVVDQEDEEVSEWEYNMDHHMLECHERMYRHRCITFDIQQNVYSGKPKIMDHSQLI